MRSATLAAIGSVLALGAGAIHARPELQAEPLIRRDALHDVEAIFVFSGDVDFHRTLFAARIFRDAGARWFIVSGAGAGGDSGAEMASAAERAGIPREVILVEPLATTTRENAVFSRALLDAHAIHSVAVVTSPFHSRRAAWAAERAWPGVAVISLPVPESDPLECGVREWRTEPGCSSRLTREWEKLLGYWLRRWV